MYLIRLWAIIFLCTFSYNFLFSFKNFMFKFHLFLSLCCLLRFNYLHFIVYLIGGRECLPVHVLKIELYHVSLTGCVLRSFEPPKRDEETETQRKARAKHARQTRRSTQVCHLDRFIPSTANFLPFQNKQAELNNLSYTNYSSFFTYNYYKMYDSTWVLQYKLQMLDVLICSVSF